MGAGVRAAFLHRGAISGKRWGFQGTEAHRRVTEVVLDRPVDRREILPEISMSAPTSPASAALILCQSSRSAIIRFTYWRPR